MSLTVVIILIALGILLLIIELLIIPGITIAGIGGVILLITGIYFAYKNQGTEVGNYILLGSVVIGLTAAMYSLRTKTWKNVGLNSNIDSKVEAFDKAKINVGDHGKTVTRLAPIGKAMVNDVICEAKSHAEFIDENTDIEVIKINNNQIIVKSKKIS